MKVDLQETLLLTTMYYLRGESELRFLVSIKTTRLFNSMTLRTFPGSVYLLDLFLGLPLMPMQYE